jgi:hypothetical protein
VSKQRAKGTAWETAIVKALRDNGFPYAERRALHGTYDLGDITGIPGVVIEAKNAARHEIASWLDEAETEKANAKADVGAVWFKRKGKASAEDGFVLMTGTQFMALLRDAIYVQDPT